MSLNETKLPTKVVLTSKLKIAMAKNQNHKQKSLALTKEQKAEQRSNIRAWQSGKEQPQYRIKN